MVKIIFLGTGGGRINLIKQIRKTGGFRIIGKKENIHVDPGPGALIYSNKLGLNPLKITAIIVSHYHLDHSNDANLLIEGMTGYGFKKKGVLIASEFSINGDEKGDWVISKYHQGLVKKIVIGIPNESFSGENFNIKFTKTKHDEKSAFGFVMDIDKKRIGYTSDTEYFKGISEQYMGCDLLIINCLKPTEDGIPDHLKLSDCEKMIKEAKPKMTILTHLGLKMINKIREGKDPGKELTKKTGIKTISAKDFMEIVI